MGGGLGRDVDHPGVVLRIEVGQFVSHRSRDVTGRRSAGIVAGAAVDIRLLPAAMHRVVSRSAGSRQAGDNTSPNPLDGGSQMTIRVRFFASLREATGCREVEIDAARAATAAEAWRLATGGRPIPDNVLVAVNLEYANVEASIRAGDEVAFFPPVTGG